MNYRSVYDSVVKRGLERKNLEGYSEIHHIVPKSLGGSNEQNNLVVLTAREHFICHLLLTKIYKEDSVEWVKMIKAFECMLCRSSDNQKRYFNSHWYSFLRERFSKAQSINQSGKGNSQFGKRWIINPISNEIRKVDKSDLEKFLNNGWLRGKTLNPKYRKLTDEEKNQRRLQRAKKRELAIKENGKVFFVKNKKTGEKRYLHENDIKVSEDLWESNYRDIDENDVIKMLSDGMTLGKIAKYYNLKYYAFYEWYRKRKDRIKPFIHKDKKLCPICGNVVIKRCRTYCSKECYQVATKQMHWIRKDGQLKHCIDKELFNYLSDGWVEVLPVGTKNASEWIVKNTENVE